MTFKPENLGFKKANHNYQTVIYYELDRGGKTAKSPDFQRLNVYLSQDGDYINIWTGLIEPFFVESKLKYFDPKKIDIDFDLQYNETRFVGHIQNDEEAKIIFKALRIEDYLPQYLSSTKEYPLRCEYL